MNSTERKYYSLLEITQSLESVIRKTYTQSYWVKAEIAKLNLYSHSGHCYPDLVEKEGNKVLAQIRSTIWAGNFERISTKFKEVTKEPLQDGMSVLLLAKIGFHPVYGISLNITDIEPSFTLGEMAREKTASIEKLKKEGLFYQNKSLVFPLVPQRLAIISVETSKGYHDFLQILENNSWKYRFFHRLFPALLQGEGAIKSIRQQLGEIQKKLQSFDLVLIIRGGGGDVGLSSYDNYALAKEVASFPLPVITGIGHSTNETVVEMVAHSNKITPTDLAYFLIQQFHNFSVRLSESGERVSLMARELLKLENQRLENNSRNFEILSKRLLLEQQNNLRSITQQIRQFTKQTIDQQQHRLKITSKQFAFNPLQILANKKSKIINKIKELEIFSHRTTEKGNTKLHLLTVKVNLLRPEHILQRGYSITTLNGKPIKDISGLEEQNIVETTLFKGKFKSRIESIQNEE